MLQTGELGRHVGVSLMRVLIGYVCGCLLGVGLGAAIGRFRVFRELVEPLIELIRPISPVAVVPLAMMWFGIGEFAKFVIIVYATVVIVLLNTAAGVERTPMVRIRAARCLGASEARSEEHTSELQLLMRSSYAVFCLKKKTYNSIRK